MAVVIALLGLLVEAPWLHEKIWIIYAFHAAAGVLFFLLNYAAYRKGDQVYVLGSLAALTAKLFLGAAFAAVFILKNVENELWFVLDFMLLYLFFTIFEITVIISNLRAQKNT